MNENSLQIKSMKFKQVNFVNTRDLFFKVRASEEIIFENCDFKFHKTPAINVIHAKEVKFNQCKLDLLDETSVKISADNVEFINTMLEQPLKHRAQSFTSLKADLRQDINRGFAFSWCHNGSFP